MNERTLKELQSTFKRGWYRKGNYYRFLHSLDISGLLIYQKKSDFVKNKRTFVGINPDADRTHWFDRAEYIGLKLPEEENK